MSALVEFCKKPGGFSSFTRSVTEGCFLYANFLISQKRNMPFCSCVPCDLALSGSEAGGDLVLIQTSCFSHVDHVVLMLTTLH